MTTKIADICIRRMKLDDLDEVQALFAKQIDGTDDLMSALRISAKQHAWEMRRLRQQWLSEQRYQAFVATIKDAQGREHILGYAAAVVEQQAHIFKVESLASLGELWVEPAHRRRGIGRALVSAVQEACLDLGIPFVNVHLSGANQAVQAFFVKLGYHLSAVEMRHQNSYFPPPED